MHKLINQKFAQPKSATNGYAVCQYKDVLKRTLAIAFMVLFKPHLPSYMSAHHIAFVERVPMNWTAIFHQYTANTIKAARAENKGSHYLGPFVIHFYIGMGLLEENEAQAEEDRLGPSSPKAGEERIPKTSREVSKNEAKSTTGFKAKKDKVDGIRKLGELLHTGTKDRVNSRFHPKSGKVGRMEPLVIKRRLGYYLDRELAIQLQKDTNNKIEHQRKLKADHQTRVEKLRKEFKTKEATLKNELAAARAEAKDAKMKIKTLTEAKVQCKGR
ncbi:hypothetical protein R1flu_008305 [Riccia fluitans]|uniref:Uncharacterized protein n=1 Tax=Riccia fluitans TaxID=41844 RepID=A0ABD1YBJ2_9MARC